MSCDREREAVLLCMSGRTEEAMAYRERIESKEAKDNAGEEDQTV